MTNVVAEINAGADKRHYFTKTWPNIIGNSSCACTVDFIATVEELYRRMMKFMHGLNHRLN